MTREPAVGFLGIGAQRTASTWLANSLRTHPEVWLPPRKELHYFSRSPDYPSATHLSKSRTLRQVLRDATSKSWTGTRIRRDVRRAVGQRSLKDLRWVYRYYVSEPNDAWYLSLFADGAGKLAGEITPDYSILTLEDVERVHGLLPRVRIIFIMRNPIDRAWSQVRLHWGRGDVDTADASKIVGFVDSNVQSMRSDYVSTLRRWRSVLGADHVFIGYYDDIVEDAKKWLWELALFLGISPGAFGMVERINAARTLQMPETVRVHLAAKYEPMLRVLLEETDGSPVVSSWLDESVGILAHPNG